LFLRNAADVRKASARLGEGAPPVVARAQFLTFLSTRDGP
jgi:hypothetical protein